MVGKVLHNRMQFILGWGAFKGKKDVGKKDRTYRNKRKAAKMMQDWPKGRAQGSDVEGGQGRRLAAGGWPVEAVEWWRAKGGGGV